VQILNNKILYTGDANTGIQTGKYSDVSGLIISGNVIYGDPDNMGEGIYINPYSGAGNVTIQNNEFYGYLYAAVSIEASNVQVTGNMINNDLNQGVYGIRFIDLTGGENFSNVLVSNNQIHNVQYGISVGTSSDVGSTLTATISSNSVTNNDVGLRTRHGVDLTITNNNMSGNALYGFSNEVTAVVIAEDNWWGDGSGPYDPSDDTATGGWYNPTGTGDQVTDYVDYQPWLGDALPVAEFTAYPTSGGRPLDVQFTNLSTGTITDYFWEFGDGQTSTAQNPVHQYQAVGDYTVRLTVTGPSGSSDRGKQNYIHVTEDPPNAEFAASPTSGIEPLTVDFTNLSSGVVTSYYWEFGDSGTSTLSNPSHQYQNPGDYTVRLTVTGPGGPDLEQKDNYIHVDYAPPTADFAASPTRVPVNTAIQFTDLSLGTISSWAWDFDNNGSTDSTEQNPSYTYSTSGTYTVALTVTGPGGTDGETKIDYIYVSDGPIADFTATPLSGDGPLTVDFTDQSLGTVTGWEWDFDYDGSTFTTDSTLQNPQHTYLTAGDYTVALRVTGPSPPSDTKDIAGYIHVKEVPPVADFEASPTSGIFPHSVQFTDLSSGVIVSYDWEFGDGQTSTEQNPVHVYQALGDYTVRLTVTGPDYPDTMEKIDLVHVGNKKWWARTYGNSTWPVDHDDEASTVDSVDSVNSLDGGYIAAGSSNDDVWVIKLHEDSDVAWEKSFGGIGVEKANTIKNTQDGGYVLAGVTDSFGYGGQDVWVLKLASDGTVQWQKTYGDVGRQMTGTCLQAGVVVTYSF
jgi:PKD repeat protein